MGGSRLQLFLKHHHTDTTFTMVRGQQRIAVVITSIISLLELKSITARTISSRLASLASSMPHYYVHLLKVVWISGAAMLQIMRDRRWVKAESNTNPQGCTSDGRPWL